MDVPSFGLWERALPSKYSPHDLARDRDSPARQQHRGQRPLPQTLQVR